jgi:hypothetical protein
VRYDLTIAQQRFLIELSQALPMTREQSTAWDAEAATLFTRDIGRGLFATIGNSSCTPSADGDAERILCRVDMRLHDALGQLVAAADSCAAVPEAMQCRPG